MIYTISITDNEHLTGEMKCNAASKAEAERKAREYINAWQLNPATINYINKEA